MPTLQPDRVLHELEELAQLTSDDRGAQRLTWTEPWRDARTWLRAKLSELPVEVDEDEASNLWATLPGRSERTLMIGSHLDSVPDGGWLDGCLGVVAGLEVMRRIAAAGEPPDVSVCLVDWAEEEGDQSGHSLLGSTAAAGHLDVDLLRTLTSWDGRSVPELLAEEGVDLELMPRAHGRLANAVAYLELHIEQSVLLERRLMPLGVVTGTAGVERHRITFSGRRDHPARPMDDRSDALIAACRFIVGVRELARELG
jgi:hydantoinase/carbamoylase family amidase